MYIHDGKIVIATKAELFEYWLKRYDDVMPFNQYYNSMIDLGIEIIKEKITEV